MKKSRFTNSQIFSILKEAETGIPVAELCLKHGMSDASFYKWRARYGSMDVSLLTRMRELEEENHRLKKMCAESKMDAENLREARWQKSTEAISAQGDCDPGGVRAGYRDSAGLPAVLDQRDMLPVSGEARG